MLELKNAKEAILNSEEIAISGHINPDGDSIGSLLALGLGLERMGKRVYMISVDGVPQRYRHLPGADRIVRKINKAVDLAISVDVSNKEILGKTYNTFKAAKIILEIDHHDFRRPFGNIQFIDKEAASVGEMIYTLLDELNVNITKEIAQDLMTSIIVETNSFRLPNIRPYTFDVCTHLIRNGLNFYELVDMIFWSKSKAAAVLSGVCLARCIFMKHDRIAWSIVRKKDFDAVKGKDEDVDPVPDELRSIKSVRVAVLFREKDRKTLRVSLRSKGKINVAALAELYNGGGHFDVAGCSIRNDPVAIREFMRRVERLLD